MRKQLVLREFTILTRSFQFELTLSQHMTVIEETQPKMVKANNFNKKNVGNKPLLPQLALFSELEEPKLS